jgi:signal transduction histidine kinase
MRLFRRLLLAQSLYAIALGFGMALAPRLLSTRSPEFIAFGTYRFLGIAVSGLAIAVWLLAAGPVAGRWRLAAGLALGDAAIALVVALQEPAVRAALWAPVAGPLAAALAVAFAAVALAERSGGRSAAGSRVPAGLAVAPFALQAALALGLGYSLAMLWWPFDVELPPLPLALAPLRLLGAIEGAFGLALLGLGDLAEPAERRRLAIGLLIANLGAGMIVYSDQIAVWGSPAGLALVAVHLVLALGFAAVARAPLGAARAGEGEGGPPWLGFGVWATHALAGAAAAGALVGVLALARNNTPFLHGPWLWAAALAFALPLAGFAGLFLIGGWKRRLELADRDLAPWLSADDAPRALPAAAPGELAARSPGGLAVPEGEIAELRRGWLRRIGETAAQEERNRLARDLHDSIKQQLFGIQFQAAAAQQRWETDPAGARAAVAEIRRGSQEAMLEMEALLDQLQPRALTLAGLVEALRLQCEVLRLRTGAAVALELGELPGDRLDARAPQELFRIAQEALANVGRHARAAGVSVWLGRRDGALLLRIEDDGQGFEPLARGAGMGLSNMRQRTAELAGRLAVESAPGAGTRIAVELPLALPAVEDPLAAAERAESWTPALALAVYVAAESFAALRLPALHAVSAAAAVAALAAMAVASRLRLGRAAAAVPVPAALARLAGAAGRNRVYCYLAAAWTAPWRSLTFRLGRAHSLPARWLVLTPPPRPLWIALGIAAAGLALGELAALHRRSRGVAPAARAVALARALDRALSPLLERARWGSARRALAPASPVWPRAAAAAFTLATAYLIPVLSLYFLITLPAGYLAVLRRATAAVVVYAAWRAVDAAPVAR